jgi:ActR/RegA family two-component response regulator
MHRNGHNPTLRVLLSGPAADELSASLAGQPTLSMVRATDGTGRRLAASVDVALHVVASSSGDIAEDIGKLRALSKAPLILAAYGEPNGIVEAGLKVGAADVLVLPQPVETLLFALRKAAIASLSLIQNSEPTRRTPIS